MDRRIRSAERFVSLIRIRWIGRQPLFDFEFQCREIKVSDIISNLGCVGRGCAAVIPLQLLG
jgi:hypothetical protein